MKHAGQILKERIEKEHYVKKEVAEKAGVGATYLSNLFTKPTFDAALLERLFLAVGLNPSIVFDEGTPGTTNISDIHAQAILGTATISIGEAAALRETLREKERLIEEKERLIQILMQQNNVRVPGQNRDTDD